MQRVGVATGPHRTAPRGRRVRLGPPAILSTAWLFLFLGSAIAAPSYASKCAVLAPQPAAIGETISLVGDGRLPEQVLHAAIERWRQCPNYGKGFPEFVVGAEGSRRVRVEFHKSAIGRNRCGDFRGQVIRLFGGFERENGAVELCLSIVDNLAHELGHALGLRDAANSFACQLTIMAGLTPSNVHARSVTREECRAADRRWSTFFELGRVAELPGPVLRASIDATEAR